MLKLQQFYIRKFQSSRLRDSNYNIKNLSLAQARENGEIVSISNSELVRTIFRIMGTEYDQNKIDFLIHEKNKIKKKKKSANNFSRLQEIIKEIDSVLFIDCLISVVFNNKKHYYKIWKNGGFKVNGITYVPFMASAGMTRKNSALFIQAEYKDELLQILNNNRNQEKPIVPAKFNAYFALYSSSSFKVSFPKIAIVKDCEIKTIRQVDYCIPISDYNDDKIEQREVEMLCNAFDGQGLIKPELAKRWSQELELDYVFSSAIVRAPFLKGLLVTFDLDSFASKIAKKKNFIDIYGNKINIRDVDAIISESMFKLWDAYESTEQYINSCVENNLSFGVAKVNPKIDKSYCKTSYQFLQVLNLSDEGIANVCKPTLDWFSSLEGGSYENMLLYSLGDINYDNEGWFNLLEPHVKAILLNNNAYKDPYIISVFDKSLARKIKDSFIGNIYLNGNYSNLISDPYLQACHLFGLDLKPLLNDGEHYSHYWLSRNVKRVAAIRSPIVHYSEVNVLNFKNTVDTNYWYQYITSGIVVPAYGIGIDNAIFGGSD